MISKIKDNKINSIFKNFKEIFKQKSAMRTISLVLIFAFMMQIVPMTAHAAEESDDYPQKISIFGNDGSDDNADLLDDENILYEDIERREENVKHFQLKDGQMVAAVYDLPVHELDENGEWVDIDNTLVSGEELFLSGSDVPVSDGDIPSDADAPSDTDILIQNDNEPSASSSDPESNTDQKPVTETDIITGLESLPLHNMSTNNAPAPFSKMAAAGAFDPTEKTKNPNAGPGNNNGNNGNGSNGNGAGNSGNNGTEKVEVFTKKKGDHGKSGKDDEGTSFAKKAKEGKLISIKESGGIQMNWGLSDINKKSVASYESPEMPSKNLKTTVHNMSGIITYDEIQPGVSLTYQLQGKDIKENLILSNKNAAKSFVFELDLNKLTPALEDNRVVIYREDGSVFRFIEAPYMADAADEMSVNLTMSLEQKNGKKYTVTLTPDMDWLMADERVYPVTVDPSFTETYKSTTTTIDWTSAVLGQPDSTTYYQHASSIYAGVGTNTTIRQWKGAVKFDLPVLRESDTVTNATLSFKLKVIPLTGQGTQPVSIHPITADIPMNALTWNTLGQNYGAALDYRNFSYESVVGATIPYNITKTVKDWYNGSSPNYGLVLVPQNTTATTNCYMSYYSPASTANAPTLAITYISHAGLPGHLTTHQSGSGSMGAINVVDYTGNLVYSYSDAATTGSYMPVSVSHIFNHNLRDTSGPVNGAANPYQCAGTRLNLDQRIVKSSVDKYSLEWTDATGTVHYFNDKIDTKDKDYAKNKTNVYKEEWAELVKIKANFATGSTTVFDSYVLVDSELVEFHFDAGGWLVKLKDNVSGKSAIITRDVTTHRIETITDGAGHIITFDYDQSGYLSSITDPAGRATLYAYDADQLTQITRADGKFVTLSWDDDLLIGVTDVDGSSVEIEYSNPASGRVVVSKLTEYGTDSTEGNSLTWEYGGGKTVKTDRWGKSITMQFDATGHTVVVRDGEGNAAFSAYDNSDSNKKNKVNFQSEMQRTVTNLALNPGFENSTLTPWVTDLTGTGTAAASTEQHYLSKKSMKLVSKGTGNDAGIKQPMPADSAGKTFTLSAYVKSASLITTGANDSGLIMGAAGYLSVVDKAANDEWHRVSYTFTADVNTTDIYIGLKNCTGTVYIDGVQLEEGEVANRVNLVDNGSFHINDNSIAPFGWVASSNLKLVNGDGVTSEGLNGNGYKMVGQTVSTEKTLTKTIVETGKKGDAFVVGGWGKLDAITYNGKSSKFELELVFVPSDTTLYTEAPTTFQFDAKNDDWQYVCGSATAPFTYKSIKIILRTKYQIHDAIFDDIQVYREGFGRLNTYDDKGRLETSRDSKKRKTTCQLQNPIRAILRGSSSENTLICLIIIGRSGCKKGETQLTVQQTNLNIN